MQPSTSSSSPSDDDVSIAEDIKSSPPSMNGSPMDERLLMAAKSGEIGILKDLEKNSEFLLGITSQGSTCLHISLIFGHEEFSEIVWNLNPSLLSKINLYKETPLIVAVKGRHVSLASNLLNKYRQLELSEWILKADIKGDTALHHAIRHGHKNLAVELIEAEPDFSQKVNKFNESPMYIAVMRGFEDIFEKLFAIDRSSHAGTYNGNALHAAVRNGNTDTIKEIMENRPALAKEQNRSGVTPFQYAVHRNQNVVVGVLLQCDNSLGYLVNSTQEEKPILSSAASRGYVSVAKEILNHCPDAPYHNKDGLTILHEAVIEGHENFVEFILENKQLDKLINMRNSNGYSALHYAVKRCNPKFVRALLKHKEIDVRIYDNNGKPAFWQLIEATYSAKSLSWNEVFMLMSKADPQATSFYLRQVAKNDLKAKTRNDIKSLTGIYTQNTSLVAILIATITFAAAFALPGGYDIEDKSKGLPVMARKPAFKAFLISDTLAMCSSLAVAFICILARWEDLKFLLYYRSFTRKLMWFSLMATNVAFATGLYTVVAPRFLWLAILICALSLSLPFFTFLLGEWPMLNLRIRLGSAFKSDLLDMV